MKVCPHCGGQLRSSVIRCTHCGTSLIDESTEGGDGITAPDPTGGRRPVAARPAVPIATTKAQTDTEAPPRASDVRTPEPWAVPGVRAPRPPAPEPPAAHASADGTPRPNRPLMMSGVLAAAAGALAYSSLSIPWVHARISDAGAGASFVAELTLRGSDSIAGQAGLILAIALGLLGLLWFWYGLDQNAHLPAIAHPAWVLVVGLLALGVLTFAAIGTSAWRDAFVTYADDAGLDERAMQELLAARSSAVIVVERVGGVLRFGAAASLALLAGALAWWAERRRG